MIENDLDVDIIKVSNDTWRIEITYWFYRRRKEDKEKKTPCSYTTYTWETSCKELIDFANFKRTKIFYSQIKALTRNFGRKERIKL